MRVVFYFNRLYKFIQGPGRKNVAWICWISPYSVLTQSLLSPYSVLTQSRSLNHSCVIYLISFSSNTLIISFLTLKLISLQLWAEFSDRSIDLKVSLLSVRHQSGIVYSFHQNSISSLLDSIIYIRAKSLQIIMSYV